MALSKTAITAQVNTLLADLSNITPVEHRQTMYDLIDKAYDENIDGVSLVGTDLVFTRDGGNGSDIVVDLSSFVQDVSGIATNASAISEIESDLDGVNLDSSGSGDEYLSNDGTYRPVQSLGSVETRTGSTLLFDNLLGSIYNDAAPSYSNITLDATGA